MPHIKERSYTSLNIYHTHRGEGGGAQSFQQTFASFISVTGATQFIQRWSIFQKIYEVYLIAYLLHGAESFLRS